MFSYIYQRIREVKASVFTPPALSINWDMGRAATIFYKRLTAMWEERQPYSKWSVEYVSTWALPC